MSVAGVTVPCASSLQDLSHLNRPLNKVVILDTDKQSVQLQPENSIILDKWKGDVTDRTLWDLVPLLQSEWDSLSLNTLTPSLTPSLTHTLTHSLTHTLTHLHTHSLTHSLTYTLTHFLTHSLTPSLTHSLTYTLTPSLTHSLTYTLTPSLTHSLTHTLTPSLTLSPCISHPRLSFSPSSAIAVHGPSDVRPVLDSYKAEGDVLHVFKNKQVKLNASTNFRLLGYIWVAVLSFCL